MRIKIKHVKVLCMHTVGKEMDEIIVLKEDSEGLAWWQITWPKVQGHRNKDNIYQQNHMLTKNHQLGWCFSHFCFLQPPKLSEQITCFRKH